MYFHSGDFRLLNRLTTDAYFSTVFIFFSSVQTNFVLICFCLSCSSSVCPISDRKHQMFQLMSCINVQWYWEILAKNYQCPQVQAFPLHSLFIYLFIYFCDGGCRNSSEENESQMSKGWQMVDAGNLRISVLPRHSVTQRLCATGILCHSELLLV